jgi:CheY-like chemotaxis protein
VEDEPSVRFVIATILDRNGYQVIQAASGEEALELWKVVFGEIDLLFTDLDLPGMNGRELANRLRELSPGLRVLFTSGSGISVVEALLDSEHCARFLPKPSQISELLIEVREAIAAEA